jgi:PKD repeat protein
VVKTLSVLENAKTAQAVARFDGSSGIGNAPTTQYFDGTLSRSSAPGAWIVSCKWDFGDYTTSDSCWTEHTYQSNRDFAVTLTVVDSTGSIDSAQLKVQAGRAIHARARLDGSPPQGAAPLTAYFDATTSSTDEQAAWISSFEWDFGDGSPKSNAGWTPHVYAAPGQYTATLKVTDSKGNSAYDFVLVTVQ